MASVLTIASVLAMTQAASSHEHKIVSGKCRDKSEISWWHSCH